jgi:HEPN domain-containing protein
VVREAQECVELALKGILRLHGIDPPKIHDVSRILDLHREKLCQPAAENIDELTTISQRLRKDRELAFYGEVDFIPTEQYDRTAAEAALNDAQLCVRIFQESVQGCQS